MHCHEHLINFLLKGYSFISTDIEEWGYFMQLSNLYKLKIILKYENQNFKGIFELQHF